MLQGGHRIEVEVGNPIDIELAHKEIKISFTLANLAQGNEINVYLKRETPFQCNIDIRKETLVPIILPSASDGDMKKAVYDKNYNGIVDYAEGISDGSRYMEASEIFEHIDNKEIHRRIIIDDNLILVEVN